MKVVGNVLAGIVSVIYFFVLIVMICILFASNAFSEKYYSNVLKEIEFNEVKLTDLGVTEVNEVYGEEATVEDVLVGILKEAGFSENDAKVIINNDEVKELVGTFISDSVTYVATNEEVPQLNKEEVKKVLENEEIAPLLKDVPEGAELDGLVNDINIMIKDYFEGEVTYGE